MRLPPRHNRLNRLAAVIRSLPAGQIAAAIVLQKPAWMFVAAHRLAGPGHPG